jgi:hypothetical protein
VRILCLASLFLSFINSSFGQFSVPVGIGLSASTLGLGIQGVVGVTQKSHVRVGFNAFSYSDNFTKEGAHYAGKLRLRSFQATYDQFLWHSIHISGGLLAWNGDRGSFNTTIPGGQPFTLGSTSYYSSSANPVSGAGLVTFNEAAPIVLIGFGNLLPGSEKHFGYSVEAGVAFQGSPRVNLNLAGTACSDSAQTRCTNAASPSLQSSVLAEQTKLDTNLSFLQYYPIIAITLDYRF